MCPGNGTIQCALGMKLANVPWEWDYYFIVGMWEWDYYFIVVGRNFCKPMCPGKWTIQCALGMKLANVPWERD